MKRAVIVISHNQASSIPDMLSALKKIKADRFFVLDRCIDNSATLLAEETVLANKEGRGFLAGKMRDIGLDEALKSNYEEVIFLDGDRIPQNMTDKALDDIMKNYGCGVFKRDGFSVPTESVSTYLKCPKSALKVYTAGLIVKREYLDKIRALTINCGRCFNSLFDGYYGCEDYFFGLCLWACGCKIGETDIILSGDLEDNDDKQMHSMINVERMKQLKFMLFGSLDMSVSK